MLTLICLFLFNTGADIDHASQEKEIMCETGTYEKLQFRHLTVSDQGHIYFIDTKERNIGRFDERGERLPDIGRTGEGPGEYLVPLGIFFEDDRLYAHDLFRGRMIVYDQHGHFIENINQPRGGLSFWKIPDGWLAVSYPNNEDDAPGTISLCDNKMKSFRQVYAWTSKDTSVMAFNAMRNNCQFAVDHRGGRVFFYTPGEYHIQVLDTVSGEIATLVHREFDGLPFDAAWARDEFAQIGPRRPGEPGHRMAIPDKFPAIASMRFNPRGQLLVTKGNRPDLMKPMRIDMNSSVPREYTATLEETTLLAVRRDRSYYAETDDEGQIVIRIERRMPAKRVGASSFVAEKE